MATSLTWKANYTTGIEALDRQHRRVFDLVNRLGEQVEHGGGHSPQVASLLDEIGRELGQHFEQEEGCMDRLHCPMAQKNKQEHERLVGHYRALRTACQGRETTRALLRLHDTLSQCLLEHICFVDIHLRSCVGSSSHNG